MSILPAVDAQGHEIPWTEDDRFIECGLDDPDYGDPSGWPERYDEAIWELGADPLPEEPYEPTPADLADYHEWATAYEDRMWAARIESDGYISDRDVLVATGAVG